MMELVELTNEVHRAVALPQQADDLERLFKTAHRLGEIEPVGHRIFGFAAAHAQDEAAAGQVVESQRRLREQRRMSPHRVDDAGCDRHVPGQNGDCPRHRQRVEMTVRRRRCGREVGELRRPDRIWPEAHHVVRKPNRMIPAAVQRAQIR